MALNIHFVKISHDMQYTTMGDRIANIANYLRFKHLSIPYNLEVINYW